MKKQLFIAWIIVFIISILYILSIVFIKNDVQAQPTDKDICYGTWYWFEQQVRACWNIIRNAQYNYTILVQQLSWYADSASWARERIRNSADDFFNTNLSWTNVNFQ